MSWIKYNWLRLIICGAALFFIAAVLFPVFARRRERPYYGNCTSNLKQLGLAFAQYEADYDDHLPRIAMRGSAYGWADSLLPYTTSKMMFQCSQQKEAPQHDPHLSQYTDYWFDTRLAGRTPVKFDAPALRVMAGDGNDGSDLTNARYSISALPTKWIKDTTSPLYRHLETANYLFADGHVKSYKPAQILVHKDIVF